MTLLALRGVTFWLTSLTRFWCNTRFLSIVSVSHKLVWKNIQITLGIMRIYNHIYTTGIFNDDTFLLRVACKVSWWLKGQDVYSQDWYCNRQHHLFNQTFRWFKIFDMTQGPPHKSTTSTRVLLVSGDRGTPGLKDLFYLFIYSVSKD